MTTRFLVFALLVALNCSSSSSRQNTTHRFKSLLYQQREELKHFSCEFGEGSVLTMCAWSLPSNAHPTVRWKPGQGALSHWSGGPTVDHTTNSSSGGYAYFETSFNKRHRFRRSFTLPPLISFLIKNITKSADVHRLSEERIGNLWTRFKVAKLNIKQTVSDTLQRPQQAMVLAMPSVLRDHSIPRIAKLYSEKMPATRPEGVCVQFYFTVYGLSAESLTVYVKEQRSGKLKKLWENFFDSQAKWMKMEISYAIPMEHSIVIEGRAREASQPEREYRGYIAIDDFNFFPMGLEACYGHCTFDGGLCSWDNEKKDSNFDWVLSKGSESLYTGPAQDYNSFAKDYPPGNFLYLDTAYPRRYGDRAVLISQEFPPTDSERGLCMKFAYHMYGSGIGNLSVLLRTHQGFERKEKVLWTLSGDNENEWKLAQVPVSSAKPFFLVVEGTVGQNALGNIALDAFLFHQEFCPKRAAAKPGDCTFEEHMCVWKNSPAIAQLDDFDWVRYPYGIETGGHYKWANNSINNATEAAFYLTLNGDMVRPDRAGLTALMAGPEFEVGSLQCMSFHYFMYQTVGADQRRPSLGGLRVYLKTTDEDALEVLYPLWRLTNHQSNKWRSARVPLGQKKGDSYIPPERPYQVMFEGIWANSKTGLIAIDDISFVRGGCDLIPPYATTIYAECSFDKTLCGWSNYVVHYDDVSDTLLKDGTSWTHISSAQVNYGNNRLDDHTYGIPVGYAAFNVRYTGTYQKSILMSPTLGNQLSPNITEKCVSFWFAAFPGQDNQRSGHKALQVFQAVLYPRQGLVSAKSLLLWKVIDDQVKPAEWLYGQVTFSNEVRFRLLFKGEAHDGGFALDDITYYDGPCQTRPHVAHVEKNLRDVQF